MQLSLRFMGANLGKSRKLVSNLLENLGAWKLGGSLEVV